MDAAVFTTSPTSTSDEPPAPISTTTIAHTQREMTQEREGEDDTSAGGKKRPPKAAKRRKVNHACLYCRRSHMTCDEGRPCQRCIKREIGHLCHDENRPSKPGVAQAQTTMPPPPAAETGVQPTTPFIPTSTPTPTAPPLNWSSMPASQNAYVYPHETFGREFSSLSDFLETLDEQAFFTGGTVNSGDALGSADVDMSGTVAQQPPSGNGDGTVPEPSALPGQQTQPQVNDLLQRYVDLVPPVLPSASLAEKFLLTAADPAPGTRDERLKRVIRTKYEAGLLKPYNYVKGYARLSRWMDCNVSQESKQQILQPLSVLRPKFRAIAQSLRDMDLVFIEEAFERLLLDYDRVFSCMGIPACLWRRTGEIYKGNREFAELVGIDGYMLRDGRLCIYELMAEESAVNYWEKYGNVAFDSTQKAVLTSCVLRFKPTITQSAGAATPGSTGLDTTPSEEGFINCCFSFTIRRDTWGIPLMIVGNFIRC
ncbi:hypothetical protein BJY52DRAFT_1118994 [Lactarius psammicola]|nr:hypothetical protein BJY52DRAFT_1118994 [Lactarius psammicola]